ncbi:bifunctional DNA-formamidopyrimidine glycosylase/DNA-(apurinic or apyrimidinic site) lyase [Thermosulfurimonas sp.]|uniref:bifunctional DNA-formamidopyrimidine glycosylase/DNA-(apurinic or apyrimidinic site) lyase n=1 Tax=Thermosulfurimonas sp. TaxID=2080236 RepID=UPI0025FB8A20|nr:bifunctional DNA-formamidopyrimidine glycosylase/DNA-(apurinic or apyrimidinic site) lyase [Thermosulfurimonas sp.]
MPELPEVETIRRDLLPLVGSRLREVMIKQPRLVRPDPATFRDRLRGRTLRGISRRGKLLIFDWGENLLLVHLGMTGALILAGDTAEPSHTRVILELDRGRIYYADPRGFGWLEALPREDLPRHPFYQKLGPEALEISLAEFEARLAASRSRIKSLLLDQRVLAGLGNIYTDEALFRAGIHPARRAADLSPQERKRLYEAIREVLRRGIELRGSSVRDYVDGQGKSGRFQEEHCVYGRRGLPCPSCGRPLQYQKIAGRGTTFCPFCQR